MQWGIWCPSYFLIQNIVTLLSIWAVDTFGSCRCNRSLRYTLVWVGRRLKYFLWWFMVNWFFFTGKSACVTFVAVRNKDTREAVNSHTSLCEDAPARCPREWRWWWPWDVLPLSLMCVGAACSCIICVASEYTILCLLPQPKTDDTVRVWLPRHYTTIGCDYIYYGCSWWGGDGDAGIYGINSRTWLAISILRR